MQQTLLWLIFATVSASAQLTFDPNNPPSASTPPTEQYNAYTGTYSHQKGPKTVMVFLVRPSDGAAWSSPPSFATLDSQLNTASQNYYNASYHQTWFGPKRQSNMDIPRLVVTPVLDLPKTSATYLDSFGTLQSDCLAAARAQGGDWNGGFKDPNNYDRWVVMSNAKLISSTGLAYVGGRFSWTGGSLSGGVAEHEWGHNWGVIHANSWNVSAGQHPRSSSGASEEYKDGWCIMGGNNGTAHFNPQFRENLGFFERSRGEVLDVATSGVYRLYDYVHPYRRQDAGTVRALLVPMSSFTDPKRLILGFGHTPGTDGGTTRTDWNRNAVTLHSKLSDGSDRIDTTPFSRQTDDANDSAIKIGRTYSEGASVNGSQIYGGVHITPVARGSTSFGGVAHEWIDVVINYQNSISNNQPPTANFSSTLYSDASPGAAYGITVLASDSNGDTLAYDWDFGDGTYSVTNAASQSKIWTAAGVYLVTCTVSDMKGGVTVARAWVNVGNAPFRAPENPAATGAGLSYRYYEGVFNNMPDFANLLTVKSGTVTTFSLSPRNQNDNIAFLYEGYVTVPTSDVYTFYLNSDDGSRLYIGDTLVVNNDGLKAAVTDKSGNIALNAGTHRIRVEFFHRDGSESLSVDWSTLSSPRTALGASDLMQTEWGANAAPVVTVTAPLDGDSVIVGSSVEIQAEATDSDGVARVAFFAGNSYLGQDTSAPFSYVWNDVAAGNYELTAVAYDTTGRQTVSASVSLSVTSPPIRDMIGINFVDKAGAAGTLGFNQIAGAFYTQPYWNNAPQGTYAANPAWNATITGLTDQTGGVTSAWTRYRSRTNSNYGDSDSLADTSTANGRLMRGGLMVRNDDRNPEVEVYGIPYLEYDVYVYFDVRETNAGDVLAAEYVLTPGGESPRPSIWARNSRTSSDGVGDFPNYDTWVGFKEATATASNSPEAQQLGNYVVFRNVRTEDFHLTAKKQASSLRTVSINAVQIVSRDASAPRVAILRTDGSTTVTEGGATDAYAVVLAYPPTADVTVSIASDAQVAVDRTSLVFTPANWNLPQSVVVTAVDDMTIEGAHTGVISHTISSAGNYAGLSAVTHTVSVVDNDQPTVNLVADGRPAEAGPVAGRFQIVRSGVGSLATPLTVSFQMSGSAALSGDYALTGPSISYNSSTGSGSVTIPAGRVEALVTITPISDTVAEGVETAIMTLQSGAGVVLGANTAGTLGIVDDDVVDYFTQVFASSGDFDLNGVSIMFTPSGGGYTAASTPVTAFPSGTSSFTGFNEGAMTAGTADDGHWTYTLPAAFTYFGTSYSTAYVSTNGHVSFGGSSWSDSGDALSGHFTSGRPRISAIARDLDPGVGGTVNYRRITTAGEQRTIIYYNAVRNYGQTSTLSAQIELFDDGRIRLTWLSCTPSGSVVVGLSSGVTNSMPSSPFTTSASPRPFYATDLSVAYNPDTVSAPMILSVPVASATVGTPYAYSVAASDPDGGTLAITAPVKPAWLTLTLTDHGNGTATLSGTPPVSGTFPVTLQVSDGTLSTTQVFEVLVTPASGNTSPVFTSTPPLTALVGAPYSYTVATTDADGHAVSILAAQRPGWLTLTDHGNGTATLAGTAPDGAPEVNNVTLLADDGMAAVPQAFAITLRRSPLITLARPLGGVVQTPSLDQSLDLVANVDPRGGSLTCQWSLVSGAGAVTFETPTAAETRVRFAAAGLYVLRLTADNGFGTSAADVYVFAATPASGTLGNGLQGYWQLDETTGNAFADTSGNSRTLSSATATSQPTVGAIGRAGQALAFTGTSAQFARVDYAQPTAFTASAWIRAEDVPATGSRTVFAFMNADTSRARLQLPSGASRLRFFSNYNTTGEWRIEQDIPMQEWVHVTIAYDRSSTTNNPVAYINGLPVTVTRISAPSGANNGSDNFRVGCTSGGNTWVGRIDDMRLYNRIVPAADVPLLMTSGALNMAPLVTPGPDLDAALGQTVSLAGEVSDDGLPAEPGAIDALWSQASGPSNGSFVAPSLPTSGYVAGSAPGAYVLRLTADDGAARSSSTLTVGVTAAATPPTAPGGLNAVAVSSSRIDLAWSDNSANETGFIIERSSGGGDFAVIHTTGPDVTSYSDTGLAASTSYTYRVKATNAGGDSAPSTTASAITGAAGSGYDAWIQSHPGLGELDGPGDDADGDGIPNAVEFALGSSPTQRDGGGLVVPGTMESSGSEYFTVTFTPQQVNGLNFIIQSSDNLTTWTDVPLTGVTAGQPYTYTDSVPMGGANLKRFLRLKVVP